jgi:hypothetical protein
MKKILWFCNVEFSEKAMSSTGTWLLAMLEALLQTNEITLYSITQEM